LQGDVTVDVGELEHGVAGGAGDRAEVPERESALRVRAPVAVFSMIQRGLSLSLSYQALSGRWGQVCRVLAENSNQAIHARDIAGNLDLITTGRVLSGFNTQLCY